MEHRWGERLGVDLPVRITVHPFSVRHGRVTNLSVSGAMINASHELRPLQQIQLAIETPHTTRCEAPTLAAYVTRSDKSGVGLEWCEFSPPVISELLANLASRRYIRLRKPYNISPNAIAISRLSPPLLRHGT